MRFCDKLAKQRKNNNLSQEQLADKLNVSRQAVSKWESGSSYPDMDKIIQMTKILNCTLEDLLDDGTLGKKTTNSKLSWNDYFQDFLGFITKTYNMFISMTWKEKLRCLIELFFLGIFLFIIGAILFSMMDGITYNFLGMVPYKAQRIVRGILGNLYLIIFLILGIVVFLHLFKIRYLDYFITIEDNNITEKTIEESISKDEKKYYKENIKEKIIIRDPKHSTYSFLKLLMKVMVLILKFFAMIIAVPTIIMFIFFIMTSVISLYHITYGILFLYIALLLIGLGLLCYIVIYFIYNFICNKEIKLKRIFLVMIISFITIGIFSGLSFVTLINYKEKNVTEGLETHTTIKYIDITDQTLIAASSVEYQIDNTITGARIEIESIKEVNPVVKEWKNNDGNITYFVHSEGIQLNDIYKIMKRDLKKKQIRDYSEIATMKTTVYLSEENYNKIKSNIE